MRVTRVQHYFYAYKTTIEIVESSPPLFVYIEIEIRILIIPPNFLRIATIGRRPRRSQEERALSTFSLSFHHPFRANFSREIRENKFRLKLALIYRGGTEQREFPTGFSTDLSVSTRKGDFTRADDGIIFRVGVNLKLPGEREGIERPRREITSGPVIWGSLIGSVVNLPFHLFPSPSPFNYNYGFIYPSRFVLAAS